MRCVYKEFKVKITIVKGAMNTAKNKVFIGL